MTHNLPRSLHTTLLIWAVGSAFAQPTWQRTYGGLGSEQGHGVSATADGGALVVGSTGSFGNGGGDVYLMKLDSEGVRQWSHYYGGASVDQGWSVEALDDGGGIVAGFTNSTGGNGYDGLLLRVDPVGGTIWQRTIGTPDWDLLYDVEALPDGFIAAGQSFGVGDGSGDIWLVRTNDQGDTLWTRHFGTPTQDEARGVRPTSDGGFIVAGTLATESDTSNAVLLKYSADGAFQWQAQVAGAALDAGFSAVESQDGGFLLTGWSTSFSDAQNILIARVNASGEVEWARVIGGIAGAVWYGREIRELPDGRLVVGAQTNEFGLGHADFYFLFASSDGYYLSGPSFGGTEDDVCWSMDIASDGYYYLAGTSASFGPGSSAVFVVRTDGSGVEGDVVPELDPLAVPAQHTIDRAFVRPTVVDASQPLTVEAMGSGIRSDINVLDATARAVMRLPPVIGDRTISIALPAGTYLLEQRTADGSRRTARFLVR